MSGRNERSDYYISLGAFSREGIMPYSDMSRYSVRSNINTKITNWLKYGLNLNLAYQRSHHAGYSTTSTGYYNPMNIIAWGLPYATPYEIKTDENGNFLGYGKEQDYITDLGLKNYFTVMKYNPTERNNARINGNMYEEITPIKGLVLRAVQAIDAYDYRYTSKVIPTDLISVTPGTTESFQRFYRLTSTNTAEYKFALAQNNHFDILAGHESIFSNSNSVTTSTNGQTDDRMTDISHGTIANLPSYSNSSIAYNSFFARISYDYADKYFLDGTYRIDGSSLFGANKRYAPFYSVGVMWNIFKENFLKDVAWINNLQLKSSYGTMGNSGISNYLSYGKTSTGLTYNEQTSWYLASLSNPNLTWEEVEAFNLGVNGKIFDCLTFNVELYNKNTKNMLMYIPYSYISGFSGGWGNVGTMRNRGVDVELKFDILRKKDLYLGLSLNMNYNKNTITELYDGRDEFVDGGSGLKYQVGKAYGEFYVVRFAGVDPANGKSLWLDAEGNDTGTYSESNAVFIGKNRFAPWSGGASLDFSWKGLSLNATFAGVFGKSLENYDRYFLESPAFADESNMTKRMLNIWTTPGQITDIPVDASKHDSRYIEDASFVRMKNLQISYSFPQKMMNATGFLGAATIYVSGRNLLTFTKYTGWDPEVDAITAMGNYPNTKQFTIGVELKF
ncbi:MAG: SusC/RagA family TonB-linked outer membrane protein [Bacteroidales bacterium]|nr:SusC/RagA family TonB-linked outer membrane protein [Bacteroidales bacterium]